MLATSCWTPRQIRQVDDRGRPGHRRHVGFEVLPRRWVVEGTLAWLNRNRRLAKDFQASIASAKALLYLASVQLLIRRLARASYNLYDSESDSKASGRAPCQSPSSDDMSVRDAPNMT
jgi:hypothetical protein